jgi:hypothetical protein
MWNTIEVSHPLRAQRVAEGLLVSAHQSTKPGAPVRLHLRLSRKIMQQARLNPEDRLILQLGDKTHRGMCRLAPTSDELVGWRLSKGGKTDASSCHLSLTLPKEQLATILPPGFLDDQGKGGYRIPQPMIDSSTNSIVWTIPSPDDR